MLNEAEKKVNELVKKAYDEPEKELFKNMGLSKDGISVVGVKRNKPIEGAVTISEIKNEVYGPISDEQMKEFSKDVNNIYEKHNIPKLAKGGVIMNEEMKKDLERMENCMYGNPIPRGVSPMAWLYQMIYECVVDYELVDENSKPPQSKEGDVGWDCFTNGFLFVDESKNMFKIDMKYIRELSKTDPKTLNHWFENGFSVLPSDNKYPKRRLQYCLMPNSSIGCRLGFKTAIPRGFYAQVVPRSGLSLKYSLTIQNTPGTIDPDYRGEWVAIIHNNSNKPYYLFDGEKICQFIIRREVNTKLRKVYSVDETKRGEGGFGSTGK